MILDLRSLGTGTILTLAASFPLAAQAAGPITDNFFDNWQVTGGQISGIGGATPCADGFTCEILSSGDGFIQVQWVDGNATYIQTIVTDTDADGDPADLAYVDESFVQLGASNGILAQQRHTSDDTDGRFTNSSQLAIGWANPSPSGDNPTMTISQAFVSPGGAAAGDEFSNAFTMSLITGTGGPDGQDRSITIDQRVGLGDGLTASDDVQRFVLEGRQGAFTTPGEIDLGSPFGFGGATVGDDPDPVTWSAGDDIMVRWLGQRLDLGSEGVSTFGFQGIVNNDTSTEATTFSTSSAGIEPDNGGYVPPFDWHETFGDTAPTPELPSP